MSLSIRQVHPVFVGEVSGVDCRELLGPDAVTAIEAGMDQYAVLVFCDQRITDEQHLAFTRQLGRLES
jgi:alpha-ketoglutarate-dependent 2,4-dichlorophenoxyacetate dioxygenase